MGHVGKYPEDETGLTPEQMDALMVGGEAVELSVGSIRGAHFVGESINRAAQASVERTITISAPLATVMPNQERDDRDVAAGV